MHIGESILTKKPRSILNLEGGIFAAVAPTGLKLEVMCRPGRPMTIIPHQFSQDKSRDDGMWRIIKIRDLND